MIEREMTNLSIEEMCDLMCGCPEDDEENEEERSWECSLEE